MVCSHWVTLSTCTGDVIVDRRSYVSRGHPSTTQLYTSGWTCMKWTGGRATSGGERWTHTRGKQKHSFSSAYRALPFHSNTHTISVRDWNHLTNWDPLISLTRILSPFSFPLRPIPVPPLLTSPSPILPTLPTHLTILSQLVRELVIISVRANLKLLSSPTIKN